MIAFSDHALRKMGQRNLTKEIVLRGMSKPDEERESYDNRRIAYRKIGKLYLAVVYIREKSILTVITAHWEKGFTPTKEV